MKKNGEKAGIFSCNNKPSRDAKREEIITAKIRIAVSQARELFNFKESISYKMPEKLDLNELEWKWESISEIDDDRIFQLGVGYSGTPHLFAIEGGEKPSPDTLGIPVLELVEDNFADFSHYALAYFQTGPILDVDTATCFPGISSKRKTLYFCKSISHSNILGIWRGSLNNHEKYIGARRKIEIPLI